MKDPTDYNVRAVERALQILNSFNNGNHEQGISEIAQAVDLHKSTTHRIVTTLMNYGFLERSEDEQRYRLGLQVASLGREVIRRMDVRQEALPYMRELVAEWDETCDLSIFTQEMVFYIEVLQGQHALTIAAKIGQRLPAHCTASGKLFLAYLPAADLEQLLGKSLRAFTDKTITSADKLRQQLEQIRSQGYSVDDEELELGIRAVSVPIWGIEGRILAAMSIPGPINRMTWERTEKITTALLDKASLISQRLGWNI